MNLQQQATQLHAEARNLADAIRALLIKPPFDRPLLGLDHLLVAARAAAFTAGRLAAALGHLHQVSPQIAARLATALGHLHQVNTETAAPIAEASGTHRAVTRVALERQLASALRAAELYRRVRCRAVQAPASAEPTTRPPRPKRRPGASPTP